MQRLARYGLVAGLLLNGWQIPAATLTTTNVQPGGADWTAAIWKTNGIGTAVAPVSGNDYRCVSNGIAFGNNTGNTRIRNPATGVITTFSGDSLTLSADTELRVKGTATGPILNFQGTPSKPGLILDGGAINIGDDSVFTITGKVEVLSSAFISPADAGAGGIRPLRGLRLAADTSGTGTVYLIQGGTTVAQQITGNSNTFSGQWVIKCGWLLASGLNSLGTNSITVDPAAPLPLRGAILSVTNVAWFEPAYDLNSAGRVILTNGGTMILHQNCLFSSVSIEGLSLSQGTHSYAELAGSFPKNFATGGSGSITVQPFGPPPPMPPSITSQPISFAANSGSWTQLVANASGGSLTYQWQKGINANYVNVVDSALVVGSKTNVLTFSNLAPSDAADYRLVVSNPIGSVTSQVAVVSVIVPDDSQPTVVWSSPTPGQTVDSLIQIQVRFSEPVMGVEAADLLINGAPASSASGFGTDWTFHFTQPLPGQISIYWDVDHGITDSAGNPLDGATPWFYTLRDFAAPRLAETTPSPGATLGELRQARITFTEAVLGVKPGDLLINGTPAISVAGAGLGPYVFDFAQPSPGPVVFGWSANHFICDPSSNRFTGGIWSVILDPASSAAARTNIVLNEFLAANVSPNGLSDEGGELHDWIELYNRGRVAVNLSGWSLTDDPTLPAKWSFPQTNIGSGAYLIVFASGKNLRLAGSNLHANFKLNPQGGYLGLYDAGLTPAKVHEYAPEYPEQRNDVSFGLDAIGAPHFFTVPTPGGPNGFSSVTGAVAEVHFNVKHGFFSQPFNLLLTSRTPGATIVYTRDGSQPAISNGITNGSVFSTPVRIDRTSVIRATAYAEHMLAAPVESRTFLFIEDIIRQPDAPAGYPTGNVWTATPGIVQNGSRAYYRMDPQIVEDPMYSAFVRTGLLSIPSMSLVLPIEDLFDSVSGIYTHPESRGPEWERACSMELLFPDGTEGLQVDCGLQIQGGTQRDPNKNAKHSFRVSFKGEFGPGRLEHRIFENSPLGSYNTLVLDGGINMWWHYVGGSSPADQRFRAQCVRDQFTSDLMLTMGHPAFHGRFYHLYLNGLYWGIHYVHERPDDDFGASYLGGETSDYDVLRITTAGLEVVAGNADAWNAALALSNSGLTNSAQYLQLQQYIDIDNLIDYMIVNHWVGNEDWPHHNWYVLRKRSPGEGFKFIVWDAEHVLKTPAINRTTADFAGSPAQIYNALRNNQEFRLRFADRLNKHFSPGGVFYTDSSNGLWDAAHPERNAPASLYMKRIAEIDTAIVDESARWGGYLLTNTYTRNDHWLRELNSLLGFTNSAGNTPSFFPGRSSTVLSQYRTLGLFSTILAPVLSRPSGSVPLGSLISITNPNAGGTVYFTTNGTDPRVYGSGTVSASARAYQPNAPVRLDRTTELSARVLWNGVWSSLSRGVFEVSTMGWPLRFTEIMYRPTGGDAFEFIEIQNIGLTSIALGGCRSSGVFYLFPEGTSLPAGGQILLASSADPNAFSERYPGVTVNGYFTGSLSDNGERLALLDPAGRTIISVDYRNSGGWPNAANGSGASLEILDANGDPDDPANWRSSTAVNGSPGLPNAPLPRASVMLNEVMADNVGAVTNNGLFPDWIELCNTGESPVNLADWSLSNSGNSRKFIFPPNTLINAGNYLVVWCDSDTNAAGLHSGFALGRKGELISLYDASTNRIDAVSFGLQVPNLSVGRTGAAGEWTLTVPTPSNPNLAAPLGTATNLVLNEWLANAPSGGADWLELFNRSPELPVSLSGLYFSGTNGLFQLRSLSFIPPLGFVQLFADENPGPDHLDFKLDAEGDALTLFTASGQQADAVRFQAQSEGVSQGRLPDGSGNIQSFPGTASPAASNYALAYSGPRLSEIMARNESAVYDSLGNTADWLELYNPNPAAVSVAGMAVAIGAADAAPFTFPTGTSIAGNGYLRIWCDPSRPSSTANSPDLNTGTALDREGSTVFLLNTNRQVVDSVRYGFQVPNKSIGISGGTWTWTLLASPTPGSINSSPMPTAPPDSLRINEWMALSTTGDSDWFELHSSAALPVRLEGMYLTDDPSMSGSTKYSMAPLSYIAPKSWILFQADSHPGRGANHTPFSLDADGQTLMLYDRQLQKVDSVDFGLQAPNTSEGRLPDSGVTIATFSTTSSPEASNYLPLGNIFINEVLSHSDSPLEDAIEVYNGGPADVTIGGWFISNQQSEFKKFAIPAGTILPAGRYKVFFEYEFNSTNAVPFTLNSAHGDSVFLAQADGAGNLTGYRSQASFGAAESGISWGQVTTSTGVDFVPLSARTFGVDAPRTLAEFRMGNGLPNAAPSVGPVVISEIMFHPITRAGTNAVDEPNAEFVELLNITSNPVPLYDALAPTNSWTVSGDVDFKLPPGATLPAGAYALLVPFDPTTDAVSLSRFLEKYQLAPGSVMILGPYSGKLRNSGALLKLLKPDPPQQAPHPDAGFVPSILVDQVKYSSLAPWPDGASGTGLSLQKRRGGDYGNEPLNWLACSPTPGSANCGLDSDGDGMPDEWETAFLLDPFSSAGINGSSGDPDADGFTNFQEFLAGTNPRLASSRLSMQIFTATNGVLLEFNALLGHSYTVQYRDGVAGLWQNLAHVDAAPATHNVQVPDFVDGETAKFYRLVTPRLP